MLQFDPDADPNEGIKLIHQSFSYSDVELQFDESIVRRIRFDWDKTFVPVIKVEVYQYPTGGTKKFVHWGYGCEHSPGIPIIDPEVYSAWKPNFGYLATLGRAAFVSPWVQGPPFAPLSIDITPGETVPFDELAYAHAKDCFEEMKLREARARKNHGNADNDRNTIPGVNDEIRQMAYRAITTSREMRRENAKREKDSEFDKVRYVLKQDKGAHTSFLDLTDEDRALMGEFWRRDGDFRNAKTISMSRNTAPAKPGGIVVVSH